MPTVPHPLRYRQIHLDFHTSEAITPIGERFDKKQWQDRLQEAAVDSVTLFAKCHHGWSYHPTKVGKIHPGLRFNLLQAQIEACQEIGINTPIYLSAGVDNLASYEHPEWREVGPDGCYTGWAKGCLEAGFHLMDFHSPYLDYLCEQIREVATLFPDCHGIFLDITSQRQSCTRWSLDFMRRHGLNPEREEDRKEASRLALENYYQKTNAAARSVRSDMPVFHNAGHITRGDHRILKHFSHLELESLPTGGWGYDHFPMSAKYACNLPLDFLGMTGKFHTSWGEFGGYKHPNALRYECAAMIAFGAKCSIGDQLPPDGALDSVTYRNIGVAYREVREKEPWCRDASQVFDLAVLSSEAENRSSKINPADEGACRVLLEGHFLFGLVDRTMDWSAYRALILPDDIRIDPELKVRLDAFLADGGKLILSGNSGLWRDRDEYAFDIGAEHFGLSPFFPPEHESRRGHDYLAPAPAYAPDFANAPQIMYERSRRLRATTGESLARIHDPFFNRTYQHFCSHQHAPARPEPSGFDAAIRTPQILTFAHPVFRNYRAVGAVAHRQFLVKAIRAHLDGCLTLDTNLPSTARVTLTRQEAFSRFVLHLLYAPTIARGGPLQLSGGNVSVGSTIEVIEELPALRDVIIRLRLPSPPTSVRQVPNGRSIDFRTEGPTLRLEVPEFACHTMIELGVT